MYSLQRDDVVYINHSRLTFFGLKMKFFSGGGGMSNLTVNATETLNKWLNTLSIPLNTFSQRDHIVKYFSMLFYNNYCIHCIL